MLEAANICYLRTTIEVFDGRDVTYWQLDAVALWLSIVQQGVSVLISFFQQFFSSTAHFLEFAFDKVTRSLVQAR